MSDRQFLLLERTLWGLSAGFFASLVLYLLGAVNLPLLGLLAWPGAFFFQSFLYSSFFLPVFFGLLALLLRFPSISVVWLLPLNLSLVPILTVSLIERLVSGAEPNSLSLALSETFGNGGATLLLLTVLFLEVILITLVSYVAFQKHAPQVQEWLGSWKKVWSFFSQGGEDTPPAPVKVLGLMEPRKEAQRAEVTPHEEAPVPPAAEPVLSSQRPAPASSPVVVNWDDLPREKHPESVKTPLDPAEEKYEAMVKRIFSEASIKTPSPAQPEEAEPDYGQLDQRVSSAALDLKTLESALEQELEVEEEIDNESAELDDADLEDLAGTPRVLETGLPKEVPFVRRADRDKFKGYHVPVEGILTHYAETTQYEIDETTRRAAHVLKMTLNEFNIQAEVTGIRKGPVITMFEILPAPGVKLSKIVALADNIALGLAASSVRIVAPIPGKHAVGIEVPNAQRSLVGFSEMISSKEFQETTAEIPMVLGKDISGDTQIIDIAKTPHLLIAGATGSGKSVCVNSLICSILYKKSPEEVKLLMVDPKIVELKFFNHIPHLLTPVITDPKKALQAVQWCLYEMERRYSLLDALGVRDIKSYNRKVETKKLATVKLPYIVLIVDEFADLMATSGKDLEGILARLAAMSRAVGIHLVLATQRPSIDVITGLIKANFPSRIAFMVASKTDSRIILDTMGAEKLLGRGDMLFTSSWNPFPSRIQGAFLTEEEVEKVVDHVKTLGEPEYIDDEIFFDEDEEGPIADVNAESDPLMQKAVEIVTQARKASASYLQRRLNIGYNRAARMIESMEEMGIVGPQNGSKPREIYHALVN